MRQLPVAARIYVALTVACALVVLSFAIRYPLNWRDVLILAAMYVLLESRMPMSASERVRLSMGFPVGLASYIIVGPWGAAVVGAASVFMLHRAPPVKRLFNAAQFTLCEFVAGSVYVAVGGPVGHLTGADFPKVLVPVLAADLVHCACNGILVTGVITLAERVPPREVLTGTLLRSIPSYLGYAIFGLLMAVLWVGVGIGPLSAVLVLLPLGVARWAFSQFSREQAAYQATIAALVQAVETKDRYTRGHSERVARASVLIARSIGMREERVNALRYAGILHDVGKLGVPTKLLQKTGVLTEEEFAAIKLHPVRGLEMLSDIEFLDEAFKGILHHHERLDGLGYPMGLKGEQIPEFARAIAVADAFDSMTSTRSYRHARGIGEAIGELERCRGSQFDPRMVDALVGALAREPWDASGVDELAELAESRGDTHYAVPIVDHDDPSFTTALTEDRA